VPFSSLPPLFLLNKFAENTLAHHAIYVIISSTGDEKL
jgi:hypothetical protein